jgi:hypothetical protein
MVSILTLILIKKFQIAHHIIKKINKKEFSRPNINPLIKKWMCNDMFWVTTIC